MPNNIVVVDLNQLLEDTENITVGFEIPPQTQVKVLAVKTSEEEEEVAFHLTTACLGPKAKQGERAILAFGENQTVCASLSLPHSENVSLDLQFSEDFSLHNLNANNTSIYIVGRVVSETLGGMMEDGEYDPEEESEESEEEGSSFFLDSEESESEEDVIPNRVSIEQLPDEEEEEREEPPAKMQKMQKPTSAKKNKEEKTPAKKEEKKAEKTPAKKEEKKAEKTPAKKEEKKAEKTPAKKEEKTPAKSGNKPKLISTPGSGGSKPTSDEVASLIKAEMKSNGGEMNLSQAGTLVTLKYGCAFKKLGLGENSLATLMAKHGVEVKEGKFKL